MTIKEKVNKLVMSTKTCRNGIPVSLLIEEEMKKEKGAASSVISERYRLTSRIDELTKVSKKLHEERKPLTDKLKVHTKRLKQLERYYEKHRKREQSLSDGVTNYVVYIDGVVCLKQGGLSRSYEEGKRFKFLDWECEVERIVIEKGVKYIYAKRI